MIPIYDLGPKFEGLIAFCRARIDDTNIGTALFGQFVTDSAAKETLSRVKAGQRPLTVEVCNKLSAFFNEQLARATGSSAPKDARGPLRGEDWNRPLTDFFIDLAKHYAPTFADRLDDAHTAIVQFLNGLDAHRDRQNPLVISSHSGTPKDRTRFPAAAVPVDPLDLPVQNFNRGDKILIEIARPLERDSHAWLFFVRNPDVRAFRPDITHWIWDQSVSDLIRWLPSPVSLSKGFSGTLPGFPCDISPLEGEYTGYLLIEDAGANGVRKVLEEIGQAWNGERPTFEATVHMITRARTLFQKGNVGKVSYAPPRLLMRRYRIRID